MGLNGMKLLLPAPLAAAVEVALEDWRANKKVERLWARDASLWTGKDESQWMGWLSVLEDRTATLESLRKLQTEVKAGGFTHALLMGMGGSSLCPEVLAETFGKQPGFPELLVLDSTNPAQVRHFEKRLNREKTLFIVASKSGSTLEPNIFQQYFFGLVPNGKQFLAITDPGSQLEKVAQKDGFRHIFHGVPSIGGRYSALSSFGLVPAAVMGLDLPGFISRTQEMVEACGAKKAPQENPGVHLGLVLGAAAKLGRDKVTFVTSPEISDLGAWLEQLIAESTGKEGKAIIPVDREPLGSPTVYGKDRVFVQLSLKGRGDPATDSAMQALLAAGHPVVQVTLEEPLSLGQELFRWEIATAVAGSLLGINPFNQPDVEASKVATRRLTDAYDKSGELPREVPRVESGALAFFADEKNAKALELAPTLTAGEVLRRHLKRLGPGDYFGLLGYLEMSGPHVEVFQRLRTRVRDARAVATCAQFGPRFLHSTGQAYKGGPASGVFLQVTCEPSVDVPIPGKRYSFGVVEAAQASGDLEVLVERGRRALRVHLKGDVEKALAELERAVEQALK
jgi:glucose-6-phosphate isomerase